MSLPLTVLDSVYAFIVKVTLLYRRGLSTLWDVFITPYFVASG